MIRLLDLSIHAGLPEGDAFRTMLVVAEVENPGSSAVDVSVDLELFDAESRLVADLALSRQPALPGRQLIEWSDSLRLPLRPLRARWRLRGWENRISQVLKVTPGGDALPVVRPRPTARPAPEVSAPAAPPPRPPDQDRWTLAESGHWDEAAPLFPEDSLDMAGRDRVRDLLRSEDPRLVEAGCRIATGTGWKTAAQTMRRLLDHPEPGVRAVAATGIGALAGPAMEHLLRKVAEQDKVPEVREAARAGLVELERRSRR